MITTNLRLEDVSKLIDDQVRDIPKELSATYIDMDYCGIRFVNVPLATLREWKEGTQGQAKLL